jgi:hypothetical protein
LREGLAGGLALSRNEVIVRLAGGIGNQLFQILRGYCVAAERHAATLKLSDAALESYAMARRSFLSTEHRWGAVTLSPTQEVVQPWVDVPLRACERMGLLRLHQRLMYFSGVVAGYCQDMPVSPALTEILPTVLDGIRSHLVAETGGHHPVGPATVIHMRGGDALLPENRARYSLPPDYYHAVMVRGCCAAQVFSDDQAYAETLLQQLSAPDWRYVESRRGEDYLLAALRAEVMVLSRSTLSFWAGMLSPAATILIPEDYPASWIDLLSAAGKARVKVASV